MSEIDTSTSTIPPESAVAAPIIDKRDFAKILEEFTGLVQYYLPGEWDVSAENNLGGAGIALANIFADMLGNVIVRLNKLPKRNLIEFLNNIGVTLTPAIPATTPVTIALSPNVNQDVLIPKGTKLATAATSAHDPLTFETQDNMLVTTATISEIYSIDNSNDAIYRHTQAFKATQGFILFGGGGNTANLQEHSLYIGHVDLLNIKSCAIIITLLLTVKSSSDLEKLTSLLNGEWEYNWQLDESGKPTASKLKPVIVKNETEITISLTKEDENAINKLEVNGIKSRWFRCRSNLSLDVLQSLAKAPPSVTSFEIQVGTVQQQGKTSRNTHPITSLFSTSITPDALAYNEVPLNIDNISVLNPLYPFGIKPNTLDSFYIASQDAFSKLGANLILSFSFIPYPTANDVGPITGSMPLTITLNGTGGTPPLTYYVVNSPKYGYLSQSSTSADIIYTPFTSAALPVTDNFTYIVIDNQKRRSNIATVTIFFTQQPPQPPPQPQLPDPTFNSPTAVLSWEYWDGVGWAGIDTVSTTNGTYPTTNGVNVQYVNFTCPQDISPVQISGINNYWIRVRIASGNYGNIEMTSTTSQSGGITWTEDDSNIRDPQLSSVPTIQVQAPALPISSWQSLTYNNLEYTQLDNNGNQPFQPFTVMEDVHPTLYLGYDSQVVESGPVQLYVSLKEQELPIGENPMFEFSYYSEVAGEEKKITMPAVDYGTSNFDGTSNLTKTGNIRLFFPADIASPSKFGSSLFWIKLVDSTDTYTQNRTTGTPIPAPEINTISQNTVSAVQATTVTDENLGSSDGNGKQTFTLTNIPVFQDRFQLWVNEGIYLSDDEMTSLSQKQQLKNVLDPAGNLIEAWVLWIRVDDLYGSSPTDRNYTLNTALGIIQFGDNINGMVPPVGEDNIKATYVTADKAIGSAAAGEINSLKSNIPFVDSVTNSGQAEGAVDAETTDHVLQRGPQLLKNRGQAVTTEDFEYFVRRQYPTLAKVKCVPATNSKGHFEPGHVSIVIVQTSNDAKPTPSFGLLSEVQVYLGSLSSNVISSTAQLKVVSPIYVEVSITADIYPVSADLASLVQDTASNELTTFLHPLLGGFNGTGWDFGYLVSKEDIDQKLATISGIDHADNISIEADPPPPVLPLSLMCNGVHKLTVKTSGK